jgi:hypothetical protein
VGARAAARDAAGGVGGAQRDANLSRGGNTMIRAIATTRVVVAFLLSGCASASTMSPDVARLQSFAHSFQPGWRVEVLPADTPWTAPGHLATMVGRPVTGVRRWLNLGLPCVGCPIWNMTPTIYLQSDALAQTRCADLAIASLFTRRQEGIPFTFAEQHVAKEAVKLLIQRGWSDKDIKAARASCPPVVQRPTDEPARH